MLFCGLFYKGMSVTHDISSLAGCYVNELERVFKEVLSQSRKYSRIFLGGLTDHERIH